MTTRTETRGEGRDRARHEGEAAPSAVPFTQRLADFVTLTKPRLTSMVLLTGLGGMWLASRTVPGVELTLAKVVATLVGLTLVVGGAHTLNMYWERESDLLMERTRDRPLPSGRMRPAVALGFGVALSAIALPWLAILVNWTTATLAALALMLYVFAYTPLKRVSWNAMLIGAVPGAIPPLLGWTAATGSVAWPGVAMFGVLFFWQIPHFVAIATFRADEYARAGIKTLPSERGDHVARVHALVHLSALISVSLCLVPLGVGGSVYTVCATLLGAAFMAAGVVGMRGEGEAGIRWARRVFFASLLYLPALLAAMMTTA